MLFLQSLFLIQKSKRKKKQINKYIRGRIQRQLDERTHIIAGDFSSKRSLLAETTALTFSLQLESRIETPALSSTFNAPTPRLRNQGFSAEKWRWPVASDPPSLPSVSFGDPNPHALRYAYSYYISYIYIFNLLCRSQSFPVLDCKYAYLVRCLIYVGFEVKCGGLVLCIRGFRICWNL